MDYPNKRINIILFNRLSFIVVFCITIMLFCNGRFLLRTFLPISIADYFWGLIAIIMVISISILVIITKPSVKKKYGFYLFIFGVFSLIRFMVAGVKVTILAQQFLPWVAILSFCIFIDYEVFWRRLFKGFVIAMSLHLLAVLSPFDFIQQSIYDQTTFRGTVGSLGIYEGYFNARSFGFTGAPGALSFLACIGIATSIVLFLNKKRFIWVLLFIESFICGMMTWNRSFIFGLVVMVFIVPFVLKGFRVYLFKYILMLSIIIPIGFYFINHTNYKIVLSYIYEQNLFIETIKNRTYGEAGFIPSYKMSLKNPLWGSIISDSEGNILGMGDMSEIVRPHNGFANIFAGRGFFFGIVFVYWTIIAFIHLWKGMRHNNNSISRKNASLMFLWFTIGHFFALGESFLEIFPILMPLAYGMCLRKVTPTINIIDNH